ncbi:IS3 family transposase, partial [Escherichia coli]
IFLRQKQKKLIMLPSEILIWQPEFTDKTLSRKPGAVQFNYIECDYNRWRRHSWCGGLSPEQFENQNLA